MEQQRTIAQVVRTYRDQLTNSVYETLNGGTDAMGMRRAHRDMIFRLGPDAYVEGLREGGVPSEELDATDRKAIRDWINEQYQHVNKFADDTVAARGDDGKRKQILARLDMWIESMRVIGSQGLMSAQKNKMGTWRLGPTELHCKTGNGRIGCANLHGKRHRLSWFLSRGLIPRQPGSAILGCKGYKCLCEIRGDDNSVLVPATDRALRFDPNQPRDPDGKWTDTGDAELQQVSEQEVKDAFGPMFQSFSGTVYRGKSKYASDGERRPMAYGRGIYYALTPEDALSFTDNPLPYNVYLDNPLRLSRKEQDLILRKFVEMETGIKIKYPWPTTESQEDSITKWLKDWGYDGIIVDYEGAPGGKQVMVIK